MGKRRVDLHGFHRDVPLLLFPLELNGTHIVQTVGQFDHHHADVLCHGDEHLPQILHLLLLLGGIAGVFHLGQLGDAVHQNGHRLAKLLGHLGIVGLGILDGIVEQTGHDGLGVQIHIGDVDRHRHRMHDIGLAAFAKLALVMLKGIGISAEDVLPLVFGEGSRHVFDLFVQVFQISLHFLLSHTINPSKLPSVFSGRWSR